MTNFEAITKDPETLAAEIANMCRNLAVICGRKFNSAATAKELAIWLNKPAHSPQK